MIVHQRLAAAVIVVGVVGIALAAAGVIRGTPGPTLRAYVILASALIGVQVVVGGILFLAGHRPAEPIHHLYGGLVLAALPVSRRLSRGSAERGEAWALLAGCVAVVLLGVRALATGGG